MKKRPSKCDSYGDQLADWFDREFLSLSAAKSRLFDRFGVSISVGGISKFWQKYQKHRIALAKGTISLDGIEQLLKNLVAAEERGYRIGFRDGFDAKAESVRSTSHRLRFSKRYLNLIRAEYAIRNLKSP